MKEMFTTGCLDGNMKNAYINLLIGKNGTQWKME